MGLVLDTTIVIAAERHGLTVRDMVAHLRSRFGDGPPTVLSAITIIELAHGIARADTEERHRNRSLLLSDVLTTFEVYPVTVAVAQRAGMLDGFLRASGTVITVLLIASTALELGYSVLTHNLRHFRAIPGLDIEQV